MGFNRGLQIDTATSVRRQVSSRVKDLIPLAEIAQAMAEATEPFSIEIICLNPAGHDAIASCGEIVCPHCARIFWR